MQTIKRAEIHLGSEMHTKIYTDRSPVFECYWDYDNPEWESKIDPDKHYTIACTVSNWDSSGSLVGDSVGCRTHIYNFEETPKEILDLMESIKSANSKLIKYQNDFLRNS